MMSPPMQIVWEVLEAAKNARDDLVIAAARHLIDADRIGWRKHADRAVVLPFAE